MTSLTLPSWEALRPPTRTARRCRKQHRCGRVILLGLSLTLLAPASARAQQPASATMVAGEWTGWVLQPDEDSLKVSFFVEQQGKHYTIMMRAPGNADYDMSDVKLKDDVLTFSWVMGQGSFLLCRLSRRGGPGFDGQCQDGRLDSQGGRNRIFMNMTPPRTSTRGSGNQEVAGSRSR